MRSTQQISITLPTETADAAKTKVAGGEYASASEVVCEGLRALFARDQAIEQWVRTQVAPAYDMLQADPSRALTPEQVRSSLAAARRWRAAPR